MATADLEATTVEAFSDQLRGSVLRPGDEGYDEARTVWNAMIDKEPAIIARCTGTADVIAAVNFARDLDLRLAVKGGGHNVAGTAVCDDGVVIDLSPMNAVRVDPDERTARVQGGATWGDFDHEAQAFGLATTGGIMHETGVAGVTLGGGLGWLSRTYGLAHDNLRSVDVVTADGELVHASEERHPELFWGIRGGGGNFGVVTSFEFDLHEVGPEVLAGELFYRYDDAPEVLRFYRDFMSEAPDEVQCYVGMQRAPPEPVFPEEVHGKPIVGVVACYSGAIEDGKEALQPLREFGTPLADTVMPQPYTAWQRRMDTEQWTEGNRNYWKSHFFREFPDEAIETVVERLATLPTPLTSVFIEWMEGAIADEPLDATAFPHRDKAFSFTVAPIWTDPEKDDEYIGWAQEFHEAVEPHAAEGVYVNYMDKDEDERVHTAYGERYERLVELKNKWDSDNLFRTNQNIEPTV
jgi:FAD/FMN-containing dehydrogenase